MLRFIGVKASQLATSRLTFRSVVAQAIISGSQSCAGPDTLHGCTLGHLVRGAPIARRAPSPDACRGFATSLACAASPRVGRGQHSTTHVFVGDMGEPQHNHASEGLLRWLPREQPAAFDRSPEGRLAAMAFRLRAELAEICGEVQM